MTLLLRRALAWSVLVALTVMTLGPLRLRPRLSFDAATDRVLGYGAFGYALTLAYPRHPRVIAALVLLSAAGLEVAQALSPGRHPRLQDAAAKSFGGMIGILLATIPWWLATRAARREARMADLDRAPQMAVVKRYGPGSVLLR